MLLKYFRVKLINQDHLHALCEDEWHVDIVAGSVQSAWAKFVKQRKWPLAYLGGIVRAEDYDVRLERTASV